MPSLRPVTVGSGAAVPRSSVPRARRGRMQGTWRTAASSSAHACSATDAALRPMPYVTTMPRSRAAARSTPSNPAPTMAMISSAGSASMYGRLRPNEPLVCTARMRVATGLARCRACSSGPASSALCSAPRDARASSSGISRTIARSIFSAPSCLFGLLQHRPERLGRLLELGRRARSRRQHVGERDAVDVAEFAAGDDVGQHRDTRWRSTSRPSRATRH